MWQGMQTLVFLGLWLFILTPVKLSAFYAQAKAKSEPPPARLEQNTLPAAGRQKTLLSVARFGRYSILASSRQGTGLQLVDRMAGPGEISGRAGEEDGRVDAYLDRGQYLVVTHGHERATGTVDLEIHPFAERNRPQPPQLIELRLIEAQLEDFEQISYWLDIKQRQYVTLEAAGRSLADLRLWKDGNWLMDASPAMQIIYPKEGQPLLSCRLNVYLDPGLYLLTAYGGPPQPWSEESELHPFYIRRGIPRLGSAGRRRFVVSPFGRDRYLVPGAANYFRLELPEARTAVMQVDWYKPDHPFELSGPAEEISKKSIPPVAEIQVQGREQEDHIVTVTADAGQPYVLQQFELRQQYTFRGSKDYWISTIHSGYAEDSVDATAVVTSRSDTSETRVEPFLAQTIEIGPKTYWHRRINLLDQTTLFLNIKSAGAYQLLCSEVEAQYKIEPFRIGYSAGYQSPAPRPCGTNWDLDSGYHVLTIYPQKKGIADLVLRPMGFLDTVFAAVGWERSLAETPFRSSVRFSRVPLDNNRFYTVYLNRQPEVKAGLILRSLPIDLTDPLYIAQNSGEKVSVPFQAGEPGVLRAEAEDGSLLEISVDGGSWQRSVPVDTAPHTAAIRHSLKETAHYSLAVVPQRLETKTPLPEISGQALAALPKFPLLDAETPQFGDLQRLQEATYLLRAEKPALYRLQSTGLLATKGSLRSRTNPSFVSKSRNGVGRNFSLQQYLREGDYQIAVQTEGNSAGHFGLELERTPIRNGGFLTSRVPARATLEPGQAIAYYFIITNPGEFRVRALGEGRVFHCRLEDQDGWPLLAPDSQADISRYFDPGQYRMVILPESTTARVLAQIEPTPRERRYRGHGPHRLRLAERINHIWMEPENEGPRTPDRWDFTAPAPMEVRIELGGEMQGNLLRLEESGASGRIAVVQPGRIWKGMLDTGRYRLEAVAMRRNNRAPYQVAVWPTELVAGLSREIHAPESVPLSVGKTSLVEFSSFGSEDVQARLYDGSDHLIAANDDRPDDWNFQITRALAPGHYRLEVDPAGKAKAVTIVSMSTPPEEPQAPLSLPAQLEPVLRRSVQLYPLPPFSKRILLRAAVESRENVGLAIEVLRKDVWQVLASRSDKSPRVQIPLGASNSGDDSAYRLRVWSLDRREMRIGLRVESILPRTATEKELETGLRIAPGSRTESLSPAYVIDLGHPGIFQVEEDSAGVCWSPALEQLCRAAQDNRVVAWGNELWVAPSLSSAPAAPQSFRARRLMFSPLFPAALQFPMRVRGDVVCDLEASDGGPILLLASSHEGQPAIRLTERQKRRPASLENVAIAPHASASVLLTAEEPAAAVWAATPESGSLDVRLQVYSFPVVEFLPWTGFGDGALEGIHALAFSLPSGQKRFRLALGNAVIAVLSKGNDIQSVHWQGGKPFNISVDSDADRLTLLHMREEADRYAVEAIPLRSQELIQTLGPGSPYEHNHIRSGIERLAVRPLSESGNAPVSLHVRGAAESATFIGNDGLVLRGKDFVVPYGGGTLEVAHKAGLLLCWLDRPGNEAQGLWPKAPNLSKAKEIPLPAVRRLQGEPETFQFKTETPILLHVRMAAPSVSLLKRVSEKPEVEVHPDGTLIDAYLPPGSSQLCLRAIGGGPMSSTVEFTAGIVTPIGEGLGPEALLAPGDSRLFSFEVTQAGPVGIGVRASSDTVESEVLSSSGSSLGKGTVLKLDLQPGIYLLALRAPPEGEPVRVRPAVVGILPPGTGPPEDLIRKYLNSEDAASQFISRERGMPATPDVNADRDYQEIEYEDGDSSDESMDGPQ